MRHATSHLGHVETLHGEAKIRLWELWVKAIDRVPRHMSQSFGDVFHYLWLARSPKKANLSPALKDASLPKVLLHTVRDKLRPHSWLPEIAANGRPSLVRGMSCLRAPRYSITATLASPSSVFASHTTPRKSFRVEGARAAGPRASWHYVPGAC